MDLAAADHLLTTTRSVRKRLDFSRPVDTAVLERCIAIALQAPTGSNQQGWHFVVVTDADKRRVSPISIARRSTSTPMRRKRFARAWPRTIRASPRRSASSNPPPTSPSGCMRHR